MKISVVINYCTNDFRFLEVCLRETKKISDDIIVSSFEKFYDGSDENVDLLLKSKHLCNLYGIEFSSYSHGEDFYTCHGHIRDMLTRQNGFIKTKYDWVLFLDVDEIVDATLMNNFLKDNVIFREYDVLQFECYWYFREPIFRSKTNEQQPMMFNKNVVVFDIALNSKKDRCFYRNTEYKSCTFLKYTDLPLFHHYGWVRKKEEMIKKVTTWGHKNDRDWVKLIETEFSREFTENDHDFVNGYSFDKVENIFNL